MHSKSFSCPLFNVTRKNLKIFCLVKSTTRIVRRKQRQTWHASGQTYGHTYAAFELVSSAWSRATPGTHVAGGRNFCFSSSDRTCARSSSRSLHATVRPSQTERHCVIVNRGGCGRGILCQESRPWRTELNAIDYRKRAASRLGDAD